MRSSVASLAPADPRGAGYVCAAAFVDADDEFVARGETRGTVLARPRGSGGFGYDPYFLSDELGATFAEVSREEKARVSHRARAVAAILACTPRETLTTGDAGLQFGLPSGA